MSLVNEVFAAWGNPRAAMARRLDAGDGEERALFYLMVALTIQAVASLPETVMLAGQAGSPEDEIGPLTFASFTFRIIVGALVMYALGAAAHGVARLFKGQGSWFGARLALFWSLFSAAPFYLLAGGILAVALVLNVPVLVEGAWILGIAAQLVFLWVWAGSIAEVEGFRRPFVVALVIGGIVLVVLVVFAVTSGGGSGIA
ncbi:YIP1 family protein [Pontivivens insulae]|uniref:Yip1 domain-containing protein n=1 Tax=Pontivivens insulae TaxID=1639689 RepID=A0A2R8AB82_9RHOB|nr:YIP1 family protein [Pontivivens insulae]RED13253.1 hypothetical protein DFR53_2389 [Pontivivens insulae]SPF29345.1 hypothetical protein POI8812_01653 [Pontivivens insulae]